MPDRETVLRDRVAHLSLEQKVRLLTGADFWALHEEPAVGLRRLVTSDGPAGVRGERWDERDSSANVPSPTALAASWDTGLVARIGRLLAGEARRKGVDVLLAPTVNLHRTPYGGRHFECFSEDPLLSAEIGVAYVRGLQQNGIAATVKHFVANDSETQRFSVDARVDERALRELYLAPFEAIVREAGAWAVMAAYNQVNGTTMTESPLLRQVLREEWGFDGVVMSDWYAARSCEPAARAGFDLVMPGPEGPWGPALVAAVREGRVPEDELDEKVLRVLRLAGRVGALHGVDPEVPVTAGAPLPEAELVAELRGAAAAGFVLARNEPALAGGPPMLPLDAARLHRVAVIGPNAAVARTLGGGSATVFPPYTVSPLDGLRAALAPGVRVDHAPGVRGGDRVPAAPLDLLALPDRDVPGVEVRFLDREGREIGRQERRTGTLIWLGSFGAGVDPDAVAAIEVRTRLVAPEAGRYAIGASGLGPFRLVLDGAVAFDTRIELPAGADPAEGLMRAPQELLTLDLAAAQAVEVVLRHEIEVPEGMAFQVRGAFFQLNAQRLPGTDDEELARAVELAAAADVAVVVVGTTEEVESEGFDRRDLTLPGAQDELVRRVAAANPRTVVVVNSGAPVLLPWRDEVAAVLLSWFPGQEFGNALADVLLGAVEPGGRLPTTWPVAETDLQPTAQPTGGVLHYAESIHVGYRAYRRAGVAPAYPFGHGLGYTGWEFVGLEAPAAVGPGQDVRVRVRLRNTGPRPGRQVAQVYLARDRGTVERPALWLAGFAGVSAEPGAEVTAEVVVRARAFAHWDVAAHAWRLEPGEFHVLAGASSADLPLSAPLRVNGS